MDKLEKIVKKHQDGAIFNIFVTPASHNILFPAGFNRWRRCIEIKISSEPKEDKANKEVIKTVANFFDKPLSDIYILSGRKNRQKTVLVKDTSVDFISNKLRGSLDGF